jgi:hypothetical protein
MASTSTNYVRFEPFAATECNQVLSETELVNIKLESELFLL